MKAWWLTAWLVVLASHAAQAADLFNFDQRYGSIAFSVRNFGAFSSLGSFPRFMGKLLIDRAHPEHTKVDVQADATSVTVPWDSGTDLLRGPDFFDIAHYPEVRFVSNAIKGVDPRHFLILGVLEIRGIKRPLTLDATLEREQTNMANGDEIADFAVTGTLRRSDYGMTAQRIMISDQVTLQISARIELPAQKSESLLRHYVIAAWPVVTAQPDITGHVPVTITSTLQRRLARSSPTLGRGGP